MRQFGLALAGCLILGLTTAAFAQEKSNKEKLIGVWESKEGFTIEFTKDGKLKVVIKIQDKTINADGTYTVEGDKLSVVMKQEGKEQKETVTIKSLDDKKLVTEDASGKKEELTKKK